MPKKILLADDSITIQKVVELTFSDGDYEVTAVNNGARAIQKLSEMRPDIILSDIIMPEKNGYEVCEFVKSHPDYRNIPVVLLTGTFEPFDPDRADKAGCDAVVTKPFESQSLIHKVEELIDNSRASAPPNSPSPTQNPGPAMEEESPWMTEPAPPATSSFSSSFDTEPEPPAIEPYTHGSDIFGAPPEPRKPTADMPFAPPQPTGGETRAFPKMSFEDFEKAAAPPPPPPPPAPAPMPADKFDDTGDYDADSPFGAPPPADTFSGVTRAFPKMNLDDLKKAAAPAPAPEPPKQPEPPPPPPPSLSAWDEQVQPLGGETRAFPRMTFEDIQPQASTPEPSPWDEQPSSPSSSFESEEAEEAPLFGSPASSTPHLTEVPPLEPEEPAWSPAPVSAPEPEPEPARAAASSSTDGASLSDEQIDRIARRVVELMSDQVVRNIAWEVIPDLAEMVVKERIRQLEAEG